MKRANPGAKWCWLFWETRPRAFDCRSDFKSLPSSMGKEEKLVADSFVSKSSRSRTEASVKLRTQQTSCACLVLVAVSENVTAV